MGDETRTKGVQLKSCAPTRPMKLSFEAEETEAWTYLVLERLCNAFVIREQPS
jgi:hypothetical protein